METTDWELVDDATSMDSDTIRRVPSSKSGLAFDEASSVSRSSSASDLQAAAAGDAAMQHTPQQKDQHNDQADEDSGMDTDQPSHGAPSPAISRPGSALSFEQLLMSPADEYEQQPAEERFGELLESMEGSDTAPAPEQDAAPTATAEADHAAAAHAEASAAADTAAAEDSAPGAAMEYDPASQPPDAAEQSSGAADTANIAVSNDATNDASADAADAAAEDPEASYELCQADDCLPEDLSQQQQQQTEAEPNCLMDAHDAPDMSNEPMWLTVSLHVDPASADAPVQLAVGHTVSTISSLPKAQRSQQNARRGSGSGGGLGGNLRLLNWLLPSLLCLVTLHHLIRRGGSSSGSSEGGSGGYMGPMLQGPAAGLCYCRSSSGSGSSGGSSGSGYGNCSELVLVGCSSSGLGSTSGNLSSCSS